MSPLMDLLIILHILWISLSIILCITKKRRTERTESLFDLRADKAETDGSQGPDEKNTPTLGSNEKKAESLTPTAIGTTKPTKCASEVTQPLPASSTPSQPSRVITPPSPMFKSPPPRHPLKAPVKESTPLKYPDAKAKIVEPPAAIKNQPSAAAKPGSINQLSSDSRAAPGDVDAKAVGEAKNQGEERVKDKKNNTKLCDTPLRGKEKQASKRGSTPKSSKTKQCNDAKKNLMKQIKGKDETKTDTTDEPQLPSEKKHAKEISFKSSKANQAKAQFISGRKMDDGHEAKEELFKSYKMGKGAFKTGKTNKEKASQEDDDDYDEGDDTLQGIKSLKQDLDIPSTVD